MPCKRGDDRSEKDLDLTNIREHLDAVLNWALLDWDQPVTMVDPEHCLQQLHKDWLPGLRRRCKKKSVDHFNYYTHLSGLSPLVFKERNRSVDNMQDMHQPSIAQHHQSGPAALSFNITDTQWCRLAADGVRVLCYIETRPWMQFKSVPSQNTPINIFSSHTQQ